MSYISLRQYVRLIMNKRSTEYRAISLFNHEFILRGKSQASVKRKSLFV